MSGVRGNFYFTYLLEAIQWRGFKMVLTSDLRQSPIPLFEMPEPRPRKPSAKIPTLWKCGHDVDLDWVVAGYRYCPYCGSKYPKSRLNLIGRWLSYATWYQSYHRSGYRKEDMMKPTTIPIGDEALSP